MYINTDKHLIVKVGVFNKLGNLTWLTRAEKWNYDLGGKQRERNNDFSVFFWNEWNNSMYSD